MMKSGIQNAIKVDNVVKTFKIPLDGASGIKQKLLSIAKNKKGYREFTPLNGVSFEINRGEFFGIVGRNGSGKSTLLKTIAGIYYSDRGGVSVNGTLVPFIELGVGFNPELTGKENVYLNSALLGFSRKETEEMYNSIVEFAELHDFMEERLKNYSSGMQVRLAFSIAIQAKGDILLLDEVLAVGDAAFQQKCFDYFEQLKQENKTIVLVTHSMEAVKRFCSRALLLESGKVKLIGSPSEVADQYTLDNIQPGKKGDSPQQTSGAVKILEGHIGKRAFSRFDTLELLYRYSLAEAVDVVLGLSIIKDGKSIAEINSSAIELSGKPGEKYEKRLRIPLLTFNPGEYSVNISIFRRGTMEMLSYVVRAHEFIIKGNDQTRGGVVYLDGEWQ